MDVYSKVVLNWKHFKVPVKFYMSLISGLLKNYPLPKNKHL